MLIYYNISLDYQDLKTHDIPKNSSSIYLSVDIRYTFVLQGSSKGQNSKDKT